jgi:hypothetical protein
MVKLSAGSRNPEHKRATLHKRTSNSLEADEKRRLASEQATIAKKTRQQGDYQLPPPTHSPPEQCLHPDVCEAEGVSFLLATLKQLY